jgi:hypothetical protein
MHLIRINKNENSRSNPCKIPRGGQIVDWFEWIGAFPRCTRCESPSRKFQTFGKVKQRAYVRRRAPGHLIRSDQNKTYAPGSCDFVRVGKSAMVRMGFPRRTRCESPSRKFETFGKVKQRAYVLIVVLSRHAAHLSFLFLCLCFANQLKVDVLF